MIMRSHRSSLTGLECLRTASVEWNGMDMLNAKFGMSDVGTPRPQTPPSGVSEVQQPADVNSSLRSSFNFLASLVVFSHSSIFYKPEGYKVYWSVLDLFISSWWICLVVF